MKNDQKDICLFSKLLCCKGCFFCLICTYVRWPGGRVVMQRTANPWMPVRFRPWPPNFIMIDILTLTNFRNHKVSRIEVGDAKNVIIVGENGAGKTAILEALSVLSGDRGMRNADMADMACFSGNGGFSVFGKTTDGDSVCVYFNNGDSNRHAKINDENSNLGDLSRMLQIVWISPQEDRLFVESALNRRTFFDRLISNFDLSHNGRIAKLSKILSERAFALKNGSDSKWLDILDDQLAAVAVAVAAARVQYAGEINYFLKRFSISVDGKLEKNLISGTPAAVVEREYRNYLSNTKELVGDKMVLDGPHKSDFGMFNNELKLPVKLTSTGQQKSALFDLILAHTDLLHTKTKRNCIVLLDEAAAHLDTSARKRIFSTLNATHTQVWATGLDKDSFVDVPNAIIVTCHNGEIRSILYQKEEKNGEN